MDNGSRTAEQKVVASRQLGLCEGSDWFWWFGDYNPAAVVKDFEHLYRRHLVNLYDAIGYPPPPSLFQPLSQGGGEPARGGAMRPGHEDRKSTRLNSSHVRISYAVFCLKKKRT